MSRPQKHICTESAVLNELSIMSMGKTLGQDKSGPRREVVRLLRWSGAEVILYIYSIISKTNN